MSLAQKFDSRAPTLWMAPEAFDKIMSYITLCPVEINGFAYVQRIDAHKLVVTSADDVFITPQVVTLGSAEAEAADISYALDMATRAGRAAELRLQWHSHVNGSAYFSSTDMGTIDSYGEAGSQWMVSMVLNKRGEFSARLDVFAPFRTGVEMQVLRLNYETPFDAECRQDIELMVQQRVVKPRVFRGKKVVSAGTDPLLGLHEELGELDYELKPIVFDPRSRFGRVGVK